MQTRKLNEKEKIVEKELPPNFLRHSNEFVVSNRVKGFTLVEVIVVVAIITVVAVVIAVALYSRRSRVEMDNTRREIVALLREAQSRSINQEENVVWGVHFDNATSGPFFALFKGATYSSSSVVTYRAFPTSVSYSSTTISEGQTLNITFTKISGLPSTSTSIGLQITTPGDAETPENVSRSGSGKIFFDDFNRSNL